jgi:ParB-like chromosome segregation protein Spo0J
MRLALEAAQSIELEPILAADVGGALFVVDGHHRLKAYSRAQRATIPARVYPMDRQTAVLVSKLVNCGERALAMHPEQCRDAAWQYLAAVTRRGAMKLPEGDSCRTVAGRFGIGKDTVSNMLRKLPTVNPKDYAGALDLGTGWPRWRTVREGPAGWKQDLEEMTAEQVIQHRAELMAKKLGALMDSDSPEVFRLALRLVNIEEQLEATNPDSRAFDEETAEESDF